jgi:serine/threonine protein kinase
VQPGVGSKRFEVQGCLGEGGMGVVYEAIDREAGTRVALKTLKHASPEALTRLKREFRAMQDLQHPSLVGLRELVFEDGRWFLVMDLVEGVDFIAHVRTLAGARDAMHDRGSGVRAAMGTDPTMDAFVDARGPLSVRGRQPGSVPTVPAILAAPSGPPLFDEARLRAAMRQLVEALQACHAAGFVHRDIKPSNVLVTPAGKVVVLDFGLVADASSDASTHAVVGTPAYMAPEQAASADVGPEADFYSVGVLLYEALTNRVPIDGAPLQVMLRKQSEQPASPRDVAPGVPADLEALCLSLLRFRPTERPGAGAVLRALGDTRVTPVEDESRSRTLTPPFVGRETELLALTAAAAETHEHTACVVVEGESGLGKSRLVRHFVERTLRDDPSAIVLFGRCYERESVPYKAFDGVVDALARFLAKLSDAEARVFLPTRPAALVQVFPVLRLVPAITAAVRGAQLPVDPFELQSRAFAALRETLARVAERRRLVVVIDDAQWADDDSHRLLAEVLREPDAPRLMLVATVRRSAAGVEKDASAHAGAIERLAQVLGTGTRTIHLAPLSTDASKELASLLLQRSSGGHDDADAASIAADAGGHPLFIDLLARRRAQPEGGAAAPSSVEDALRALLSELDADARAIVETISLADAPLRTRVVAIAVADGGAPGGDSFVQSLQRLRVGRLVVSTGARGADRLEPYHDRVRAAVLAGTPPERRAARHRTIALALESSEDAEPRALALHWEGAGDPVRASQYAALAGDRAALGLAFDRAASFYEQAMAATELSAEDRRKLKAKLGDALANGGRGKRAADVLREAAVGAPAAEALELRRRAADQLLRSGHFDEGVPALEAVLRSVGVRLPKTPLTAILYMLVLRTWLSIRGLGYRKRDATQVSAEALVRVDTCYAAALGLSMNDQVRGAALQAANLLAALRLGEPYRAARAIALEQGYSSQGGSNSWARTQKVIERAASEADACGHPLARGLASGIAGVGEYLAGHFVAGLARVDRGVEMIRDYGRDVSLETANGELFAVACLAQLGRLRDLRERVSRYLPEKERRGDLYGSVNMRIGWANLAWLVDDDVDEARRRIDDAMAAWSRRGFHVMHYYELLARTNLELYAGSAPAAHAFMRDRWRAMHRSLIPGRIQSIRVSAWDLRARAALAVAQHGHADVARDDLLQGVARDAQSLARERLSHADARATALHAGIANVRGDRAEAARLLRESIAAFGALDMALNTAALRSVLGTLVGGDEGRALTHEAAAWFTSQTVKRPDRFVSMLAPGFGA